MQASRGFESLPLRNKTPGQGGDNPSRVLRVCGSSLRTVLRATRDMVEARAVRITDALSGNGPFVRVHNGTRLL